MICSFLVQGIVPSLALLFLSTLPHVSTVSCDRVLGFDIPRARHLIASEMSARSCAKYALRNNIARSPSRIELFSITFDSVALSSTL